MNLKPLTELYRAVGRPTVEVGKFICEIDLTVELQSLLKTNYTKNQECFGNEFFIGDSLVTSTEDIRSIGEASFTITLPTGSSSRFYHDIDDLIRTASSSISKGDIPSEFYLIEDDYYYKDENCPPHVLALESLCQFIIKLSQLADYQDSKKGSKHKLIFIHSGEEAQNYPIEIECHVTSDLLICDIPSMVLLEELTENSYPTPHHHSKKTIFSSTITDFVKQKPNEHQAFAYLVKNWDEFLRRYNNDFSTYLSGFSFHKAKREVAKSEFELADQFSKVLGDINSKLLSVPLSVAGIVALLKADSLIEKLLLLVGLLIISWLLYEVVKNQKRQLNRIIHAKEVAFNSIEGKKENYPDDLKLAVEGMKASLNEDQKSLEDKLDYFIWFSWLPILAGVLIFIHTTGFFLFI